MDNRESYVDKIVDRGLEKPKCVKSGKGLDLGSVRSPLTPVVEADQEVIQRAAQLIQDTKDRFL